MNVSFTSEIETVCWWDVTPIFENRRWAQTPKGPTQMCHTAWHVQGTPEFGPFTVNDLDVASNRSIGKIRDFPLIGGIARDFPTSTFWPLDLDS